MTNREFIAKLKALGYTKEGKYYRKSNTKILINVKKKSYERIIQFKSGNLGHVETLPFNRRKLL